MGSRRIVNASDEHDAMIEAVTKDLRALYSSQHHTESHAHTSSTWLHCPGSNP
jgi:hypothetical protein